LLAVWTVLASEAAFAHGSHQHKAAPAKAQPAAIGVTGEVSPLCPPGGSGHVCGCGNLSVCEARAKAVVAPAIAGYRALIVSPDRVAPQYRAQPLLRPQFSPAAPRAPPHFS
jgi:hypothetical protein